MSTQQKTIREILYEFVLEYAFHPERRSIIGDLGDKQCLYRGPKGKRCAFAYFCEDGAEFFEHEGCFSENGNDDSCLRPEYRGHSPNFWRKLQEIHDVNGNWDTEKGELNADGIQHLRELERQYAEPLQD
jgi:hypothetical protein